MTSRHWRISPRPAFGTRYHIGTTTPDFGALHCRGQPAPLDNSCYEPQNGELPTASRCALGRRGRYEVDRVCETAGVPSQGLARPVSISAPIIVGAVAGATRLLFESRRCVSSPRRWPKQVWLTADPPSPRFSLARPRAFSYGSCRWRRYRSGHCPFFGIGFGGRR
jgi:hypothetical protein